MARKSSVERAQEIVGGFATAKKNITIQYQGRERSQENILQQVRRDVYAKGVADEEIECINIYIKPEEQAVYYVVNGEIEGKIAI